MSPSFHCGTLGFHETLPSDPILCNVCFISQQEIPIEPV